MRKNVRVFIVICFCVAVSFVLNQGKTSAQCVPETEICNDQLDNDCDALVDCDDSDCAEDSECVTCEPQPEICNDNMDNDCDELEDCDDPDCAFDAACLVPDGDDDEVEDELDNCPGVSNPDQADNDGDGEGDECDADDDNDGDDDVVDNCPDHENGSIVGTCVKEVGGVLTGTGVSCTSDGDCASSELCQMEQEDSNGNGIGDACECYADSDDDGKVNVSDLGTMKQEFLGDCSGGSCESDFDNDDSVDVKDLSVMKDQFLRTDCPTLPNP